MMCAELAKGSIVRNGSNAMIQRLCSLVRSLGYS